MLTKIKSIFSRKNILIVALILSILTVSIGYSALSTTLNISGDMSLRIAADIRITGNRLTRVVTYTDSTPADLSPVYAPKVSFPIYSVQTFAIGHVISNYL